MPTDAPGTFALARRERVGTSELFVRWREHGDSRARSELVERSLPLARKLAARYRRGAGEPFDDLVQVASLALVNAVDRFDPKRGTSFSSFAVPTILGELKRYFRDTGWSVHVTRGAQELALRVQDAERAVSERTGRSPTIQQLADYLGVGVEAIIDGIQAATAHHATSLDSRSDELDEQPRPLIEVLGHDDRDYELVVERETIAAAARHLPEREQQVLALRFGEDLTQIEIAERIGVSQMQVSRILRRTLEQVRARAGDTHERGPIAPPQRKSPSRPRRRRPSCPKGPNDPAMTVKPAKVRLLEVAPDLGEKLDPRIRAQAQVALVVSTLQAPVGGWNPPVLPRGSIGLLVLEGFLVRKLTVGGSTACELLGPGNVLRPSDDDLLEHFFPATPRWRVLQEARLAVLDQRTALLMNRWPALTDEIIARLLRRTQSLTYLLAIHRLSHTGDRLLRTLWHFASLWGRVRREGIVIPVPLAHETLGQLVAATRPSVSVAVSRLADRRLLARDEARCYVVLGDPPTTDAAEPPSADDRLALARKRLVYAPDGRTALPVT